MLKKIIMAAAWTFTVLCFIACIAFGLIACLSSSTRHFGDASGIMAVFTFVCILLSISTTVALN